MKKFVFATGTSVGRLAIGLLVTILWSFFAYRHFDAFQKTGEWTYLLFGTSEAVTVLLFAMRTAPKTISEDPLDWLFAIGGTFVPLAFAPANFGVLPMAKHLISAAMVMQILGLLSLNRSFALVAARRELKFGGMYRFMRHPLYASYIVMLTGYVLANTTLTNAAIYFLTLGLLSARMMREEKHLSQDPAYCAYMQSVPFRILPFVL